MLRLGGAAHVQAAEHLFEAASVAGRYYYVHDTLYNARNSINY